MTTQITEFNPIKTIKVINKEALLKTVFNSSNPSYNYTKLLAQAENNELPTNILESLGNIFTNVISERESFLEEYNKCEVVNKTPKRYGKVQIENDIKAQGGIATEEQKTMLALNDLKSMFLKLHGRGTSDHYKGTSNISIEEGKIIRAAIRAFKVKTADVLKRKKK